MLKAEISYAFASIDAGHSSGEKGREGEDRLDKRQTG